MIILMVIIMAIEQIIKLNKRVKVGQHKEEELEVGLWLMVGSTIKGMMMKIKDQTTSTLELSYSNIVTQINTLSGY